MNQDNDLAPPAHCEEVKCSIGSWKRMVAKIRAREYIMTVHAEEEMNADGLTIFDVERGILTGAIVGRQREEETKEWKYLVQGETVAGDGVTVVVKMSPTGKLVIITVFLE